ncbi:hybrid sensor histidine kinase/response regulator, partial [Fischerella thermalis CCMEE 5319]
IINNKNLDKNCLLEDLVIDTESYQSNQIQKLDLEKFSIPISETPKNICSTVTAESKIIPKSDVKPDVLTISRQKTFVRVDVEDLQRLDYLVGELLISEQRYNLQNEKLKDIIKQLLQQLHQYQNGLEDTLQLQKTADSLNAVLQQSQQMQHKQQSLVLNVIDQLVSARMLPVGYVVERFPHMLQHLSQVYGKQVQLQLTGTQVLVDKAIAEKLYDPLLQLLRNAFDHGIELPEVRRQQGKPEQGVIEISAYHRGSQTVIEVRDDGQGLNFHKIYTKAVQLGLLSADNTSITSNQLFEFLFQPGFSTTDQVSEISGRG